MAKLAPDPPSRFRGGFFDTHTLARIVVAAGPCRQLLLDGEVPTQESDHLWAVRRTSSPILAARAGRGPASMRFIGDSVVTADRPPEYLAGLDVILEEERSVDLVVGLNGASSGEPGDGRPGGTFRPRIFGEAMRRAFGPVKHAVDPRGVFGPGAVVPLPGQDPPEGLPPLRRVR